MKKALIISILIISMAACTSKPNAQAEFHVRGNCEMCKERIDKTVLAIRGVDKADWNVETETIQISYDSTIVKPVDIEKVIAATGHATTHMPMDTAAHAKLPECCQVNQGFAH